LKGGPGTGKSYLMNRLADEARARGYTVTYFHCSSDPDSLDGVIVQELGIGMMDGTSPHTRDPKYPGVKEEIINLGDFWRKGILQDNKNSIKKLSDEKSACYSQAISMLGIYDKAALECEKIIKNHYDHDKAYKMFLRLFKNAKSDHKPHTAPFIYESPGMRGLYKTSFSKTTRIYKIPSYYSLEYLLTDTAIEVLSRLGVSYEYSFSPFRSGRFNGIYLPSNDVALVTDKDTICKDEVKLINPKRFVNAHTLSIYKKDLRKLNAHAEQFICYALENFGKMRNIHFGIEDIYLSSMDLEAKEKFSTKLIKEILKQ
jgi:hypothetical protein